MHVHSSPDVRPRLLDDIQVAQAARDAGMRAVLLKSHVTLTADRAAIAERVVGGIRVWGGLALNDAVGGLNPAAVEGAIRMGARIIWMPTISAACDVAYYRRHKAGSASAALGGITILDDDGALRPVVHEILDVVAGGDVTLSTGHLSPMEVVALVAEARKHGVRRILISHPELALSAIAVDVQVGLAGEGVWLEHCYMSTLFTEPTALEDIAERIRRTGPERVVLTSDLGLTGFPLPVDGMRAYLAGLMRLGLSWGELIRMARDNPAALLAP